MTDQAKLYKYPLIMEAVAYVLWELDCPVPEIQSFIQAYIARAPAERTIAYWARNGNWKPRTKGWQNKRDPDLVAKVRHLLYRRKLTAARAAGVLNISRRQVNGILEEGRQLEPDLWPKRHTIAKYSRNPLRHLRQSSGE